MTWRRTAAISIACLILGGLGLFVLRGIITRQDRNTDAVRVSCILLQTAILQSGATTVRVRELPPAARAAGKLSSLEDRVLMRGMTPAERARALKLRRQIAAGGGAITLPDCDVIVKHPERVEELDILDKKHNAKHP